MTTSSSPCFFHSSRMYSASSLLRFDPATWGSAVKMRSWRRSSAGVGMDLNSFSTSASWAEEEGVKPWIWALAAVTESERRAIASERQRVMGGCDCTAGTEAPFLDSAQAFSRYHRSRNEHSDMQRNARCWRTVTGPEGPVPHRHGYFALMISVSRSAFDSSRTRCGYFSPP